MGYTYNKSAALPLLGPEMDISTMHVDDFSDYSQANTSSFLFCGKKGSKHLGLNL